ncbi:MAG: glycosyltransferase family 39 protein [Chloroflexi bacterium]|nr:glycosyltransferase family 39 protein [Chloroflexota bacterium]
MLCRFFGHRAALRVGALLLLIVTLSFLPYLPAFGGYLSGDDFPLIDDNAVEGWNSLGTLFTDARMSGRENSYYRPVLRLSFAVNYLVGALDPFSYHFVNVVLHAIAGVLVFLLARRLTSGLGAAFLAAIVFAVHHANSSVVYVANQRGDILVTIFVVTGFLLYLKHWENRGRKQGSLLLAGVLASYFLALLSKETALVFPALIAAYVFIRGEGREWRDLLRILGFLAVPTGVYFTLVAWTNGYTPATLLKTADSTGGFIPLSLGLVAARNLLVYVVNPLLPIDSYWLGRLFSSFSIFGMEVRYPFLPLGPGVLALFVAMAIGGLFLLRRLSREALFLLAWTLLCLVPALPMPDIAERRLYLPLVGFSIFLALVARSLMPFFRVRLGTAVPLFVAVALLLTASSVSTLAKSFVHREAERLVQETLTAVKAQYARLPDHARVYAANAEGVRTGFPEPGFGGLAGPSASFGAALRRLYNDTSVDGRVVGYEELQRLRVDPGSGGVEYLFLLYTERGELVELPRLTESP